MRELLRERCESRAVINRLRTPRDDATLEPAPAAGPFLFHDSVVSGILVPFIFSLGVLHYGDHGLRDFEFAKRIARDGVITQGVITAIHQCLGGGGAIRAPICSVDYMFDANGRIFRRTWFETNLGPVGQPIKITYLMSSPAHSFPGSADVAGAEAMGQSELISSLVCLAVAMLFSCVTSSINLSRRTQYIGLAYGAAAYAVWIGASLAGISRL